MAREKLERRASVDPAVAELLGDAQRRSAERALPVKDRQARVAARKKVKARSRVVWDIPEDVQAALEQLAKAKGCPTSQVVELILRSGLSMIEAGNWRIDDYPAAASRSPRYEVNLVIGETLDAQGTPLEKRRATP